MIIVYIEACITHGWYKELKEIINKNLQYLSLKRLFPNSVGTK